MAEDEFDDVDEEFEIGDEGDDDLEMGEELSDNLDED